MSPVPQPQAIVILPLHSNELPFTVFILVPEDKASCLAFQVDALAIFQSAIAVAFQVPVPIIPTVVIEDCPT